VGVCVALIGEGDFVLELQGFVLEHFGRGFESQSPLWPSLVGFFAESFALGRFLLALPLCPFASHFFVVVAAFSHILLSILHFLWVVALHLFLFFLLLCITSLLLCSLKLCFAVPLGLFSLAVPRFPSVLHYFVVALFSPLSVCSCFAASRYFFFSFLLLCISFLLLCSLSTSALRWLWAACR